MPGGATVPGAVSPGVTVTVGASVACDVVAGTDEVVLLVVVVVVCVVLPLLPHATASGAIAITAVATARADR
jgi:hypothetical protein